MFPNMFPLPSALHYLPVLLQWGLFFLSPCSLLLHFPHCPLPPQLCCGAKQNSHLVLNSALLAEHTFSLTNALYQEATMIWDNLPSNSPFSLYAESFKNFLTWKNAQGLKQLYYFYSSGYSNVWGFLCVCFQSQAESIYYGKQTCLQLPRNCLTMGFKWHCKTTPQECHSIA